jgi:zinc/manganese transport system permease protein
MHVRRLHPLFVLTLAGLQQALAVRGMGRTGGLIAAYAIGVLGYALGLAASARFDLLTGAVIIWVIALTGVIGSLLRVRAHA